MIKFITSLFKRAKRKELVFIGPRDLWGQDLLRYLMWAKDPALQYEFFNAPIRPSHLGMVFRQWKAKYPEDFTEVDGSSDLRELFRNPRRHIILSPGGTGV